MPRRSLPFKYFALGLSVVYFATNCALAHAPEANFWSERRKSLAQLPADPLQSIGAVANGLVRSSVILDTPSSAQGLPDRLIELISPYASIGDVHLSRRPGAPLILHIQDAHGVETAQRNIARVLEEISPTLVGMEGASGRFDLAPYRNFPDPTVAGELCDFFLKEGDIGGPEIAGLADPTPPTFQGVEDMALYDANVRALKDSFQRRSELKSLLAGYRGVCDRLKEKIYPPALKEFDRRYSAYRSRNEGLADYVRYLLKTDQGLLPRYPNLQRLSEVLGLEERLDFHAAEQERLQLAQTLTKKLSRSDLDLLVQKSISLRSGRLSYGNYHRFLRELCWANGVALADDGPFGRYIRYVLLAEKIDRNAVLGEMASLEDAVLDTLTRGSDPALKKLAADDRGLILLDKLSRHAMTPTDWTLYEARREEILDIPRGLNAGPAISGDLIRPFEDFCRLAILRNRAMVDNLLKAASGNSTAVLVAGGFHTDGLTSLLRQKDVSYAVLIPKIAEVPQNQDYLNIFVRDSVPLEKMLEGEKINLVYPPTLAPSSADAARGNQIVVTTRMKRVRILSFEKLLRGKIGDIVELASGRRLISLPEEESAGEKVLGSLKADGAEILETYRIGQRKFALYKVPESWLARLRQVFSRGHSVSKQEPVVFPVGGLIGKYVVLSEVKLEDGPDGQQFLTFDGQNIDTKEERYVQIAVERIDRTFLTYLVGRWMDPSSWGTQISEIANWFLSRKRGSAKFFILKKTRVFRMDRSLEVDADQVYGLGAPGLIGVHERLRNNNSAWFHEIGESYAASAVSSGERTKEELLEWLLSGLRDRTWYDEHVNKRKSEKLKIHYALRALQKQFFQSEDLDLTHIVQGRPSDNDVVVRLRRLGAVSGIALNVVYAQVRSIRLSVAEAAQDWESLDYVVRRWLHWKASFRVAADSSLMRAWEFGMGHKDWNNAEPILLLMNSMPRERVQEMVSDQFIDVFMRAVRDHMSARPFVPFFMVRDMPFRENFFDVVGDRAYLKMGFKKMIKFVHPLKEWMRLRGMHQEAMRDQMFIKRVYGAIASKGAESDLARALLAEAEKADVPFYRKVSILTLLASYWKSNVSPDIHDRLIAAIVQIEIPNDPDWVVVGALIQQVVKLSDYEMPLKDQRLIGNWADKILHQRLIPEWEVAADSGYEDSVTVEIMMGSIESCIQIASVLGARNLNSPDARRNDFGEKLVQSLYRVAADPRANVDIRSACFRRLCDMRASSIAPVLIALWETKPGGIGLEALSDILADHAESLDGGGDSASFLLNFLKTKSTVIDPKTVYLILKRSAGNKKFLEDVVREGEIDIRYRLYALGRYMAEGDDGQKSAKLADILQPEAHALFKTIQPAADGFPAGFTDPLRRDDEIQIYCMIVLLEFRDLGVMSSDVFRTIGGKLITARFVDHLNHAHSDFYFGRQLLDKGPAENRVPFLLSTIGHEITHNILIEQFNIMPGNLHEDVFHELIAELGALLTAELLNPENPNYSDMAVLGYSDCFSFVQRDGWYFVDGAEGAFAQIEIIWRALKESPEGLRKPNFTRLFFIALQDLKVRGQTGSVLDVEQFTASWMEEYFRQQKAGMPLKGLDFFSMSDPVWARVIKHKSKVLSLDALLEIVRRVAVPGPNSIFFWLPLLTDRLSFLSEGQKQWVRGHRREIALAGLGLEIPVLLLGAVGLSQIPFLFAGLLVLFAFAHAFLDRLEVYFARGEPLNLLSRDFAGLFLRYLAPFLPYLAVSLGLNFHLFSSIFIPFSWIIGAVLFHVNYDVRRLRPDLRRHFVALSFIVEAAFAAIALPALMTPYHAILVFHSSATLFDKVVMAAQVAPLVYIFFAAPGILLAGLSTVISRKWPKAERLLFPGAPREGGRGRSWLLGFTLMMVVALNQLVFKTYGIGGNLFRNNLNDMLFTPALALSTFVLWKIFNRRADPRENGKRIWGWALWMTAGIVVFEILSGFFGSSFDYLFYMSGSVTDLYDLLSYPVGLGIVWLVLNARGYIGNLKRFIQGPGGNKWKRAGLAGAVVVALVAAAVPLLLLPLRPSWIGVGMHYTLAILWGTIVGAIYHIHRINKLGAVPEGSRLIKTPMGISVHIEFDQAIIGRLKAGDAKLLEQILANDAPEHERIHILNDEEDGGLNGRTVYLELEEPVKTDDGREISWLRVKGVRIPLVPGAVVVRHEGWGFVARPFTVSETGNWTIGDPIYEPQGGMSKSAAETEFHTMKKGLDGWITDYPVGVGHYEGMSFEEELLGFVIAGMTAPDYRLSDSNSKQESLVFLSEVNDEKFTLDSDQSQSFMQDLGRSLRSFHDAGYFHQYPHFGNIGAVQVDGRYRPVLRDFEDALHIEFLPDEAKREATYRLIDLVAVLYRINVMTNPQKKFQEKLVESLLRGYFPELFSAGDVRRNLPQVMRLINLSEITRLYESVRQGRTNFVMMNEQSRAVGALWDELHKLTGERQYDDPSAPAAGGLMAGEYEILQGPALITARASGEQEDDVRLSVLLRNIATEERVRASLETRFLSDEEIREILLELPVSGNVYVQEVLSWLHEQLNGEFDMTFLAINGNSYGIQGIGANRIIGVSEELVDDPVAWFHEIAEAYAASLGRAGGDQFAQTIVGSLQDRRWYDEHVNKPGRTGLEIHYALRALQREVFGEADVDLTSRIKGLYDEDEADERLSVVGGISSATERFAVLKRFRRLRPMVRTKEQESDLLDWLADEWESFGRYSPRDPVIPAPEDDPYTRFLAEFPRAMAFGGDTDPKRRLIPLLEEIARLPPESAMDGTTALAMWEAIRFDVLTSLGSRPSLPKAFVNDIPGWDNYFETNAEQQGRISPREDFGPRSDFFSKVRSVTRFRERIRLEMAYREATFDQWLMRQVLSVLLDKDRDGLLHNQLMYYVLQDVGSSTPKTLSVELVKNLSLEWSNTIPNSADKIQALVGWIKQVYPHLRDPLQCEILMQSLERVLHFPVSFRTRVEAGLFARDSLAEWIRIYKNRHPRGFNNWTHPFKIYQRVGQCLDVIFMVLNRAAGSTDEGERRFGQELGRELYDLAMENGESADLQSMILSRLESRYPDLIAGASPGGAKTVKIPKQRDAVGILGILVNEDPRACYLALQRLNQAKDASALESVIRDDSVRDEYRIYAMNLYAASFVQENASRGDGVVGSRYFQAKLDDLAGALLPSVKVFLDRAKSDWGNFLKIMHDPMIRDEEIKVRCMAVLLLLQYELRCMSVSTFIAISRKIKRAWVMPGDDNADNNFVFGLWYLLRPGAGKMERLLLTIAHEIGHNIPWYDYDFSPSDLRTRTVHELLGDLTSKAFAQLIGADFNRSLSDLDSNRHFDTDRETYYAYEEHDGARAQQKAFDPNHVPGLEEWSAIDGPRIFLIGLSVLASPENQRKSFDELFRMILERYRDEKASGPLPDLGFDRSAVLFVPDATPPFTIHDPYTILPSGISEPILSPLDLARIMSVPILAGAASLPYHLTGSRKWGFIGMFLEMAVISAGIIAGLPVWVLAPVLFYYAVLHVGAKRVRAKGMRAGPLTVLVDMSVAAAYLAWTNPKSFANQFLPYAIIFILYALSPISMMYLLPLALLAHLVFDLWQFYRTGIGSRGASSKSDSLPGSNLPVEMTSKEQSEDLADILYGGSARRVDLENLDVTRRDYIIHAPVSGEAGQWKDFLEDAQSVFARQLPDTASGADLESNRMIALSAVEKMKEAVDRKSIPGQEGIVLRLYEEALSLVASLRTSDSALYLEYRIISGRKDVPSRGLSGSQGRDIELMIALAGYLGIYGDLSTPEGAARLDAAFNVHYDTVLLRALSLSEVKEKVAEQLRSGHLVTINVSELLGDNREENGLLTAALLEAARMFRQEPERITGHLLLISNEGDANDDTLLALLTKKLSEDYPSEIVAWKTLAGAVSGGHIHTAAFAQGETLPLFKIIKERTDSLRVDLAATTVISLTRQYLDTAGLNGIDIIILHDLVNRLDRALRDIRFVTIQA